MKSIHSIFSIIILFIFSIFILYSINKSDKARCFELQKQSIKYNENDFYITIYEKDMCDYFNININAKVK